MQTSSQSTATPPPSSASSESDLSQFFLVSLALHIFVVLVLTMKAVFFPSEPIELMTSVQVDLVALPDKNVEKEIDQLNKTKEPPKELKKPDTKNSAQEKVIETKTPKAPSFSDSDKTQKEALNRIKAMEAIEKLKKQTAEAAKEPVKGNVLSEGNATSGLTKVQYDRYIGDLTMHVRRFWSVPTWLSQEGLRTQVLVKIDASGFVSEKSIVVASGNPSFDEYAMTTIEKAQPFPAPPKDLSGELSVRGVVFAFPD